MKPLNKIRPVPGMVLNVYLSTAKLGSGVKVMLVLGCSARYVTLYYIPRLLTCKIPQRQWPRQAASLSDHTLAALLHDLRQRRELYDRAGVRYDHNAADRAEKLREIMP